MSSTHPLTRAERLAHAREALRTKALDDARDTFARLGVTPTPEQLAEAAERLHKDGQRARMAKARAKRWPTPEEREAQRRVADEEWANRQANTFAAAIRSYEPTLSEGAVYRLVDIALAEELDAPDGLNRARAVKRLQAYVDRAKAESEAQSQRLTGTLPTVDVEL